MTNRHSLSKTLSVHQQLLWAQSFSHVAQDTVLGAQCWWPEEIKICLWRVSPALHPQLISPWTSLTHVPSQFWPLLMYVLFLHNLAPFWQHPLETGSDLRGEGLSPTRLPYLPCQSPNTSPDYQLCFWPTCYRSKVSMTPPPTALSWVWLICKSGSQDLEKHVIKHFTHEITSLL